MEGSGRYKKACALCQCLFLLDEGLKVGFDTVQPVCHSMEVCSHLRNCPENKSQEIHQDCHIGVESSIISMDCPTFTGFLAENNNMRKVYKFLSNGVIFTKGIAIYILGLF